MTPVERVERMLSMECVKEKDDAGIFIPAAMDSVIKRKAYEECLRVMKRKEENGPL